MTTQHYTPAYVQGVIAERDRLRTRLRAVEAVADKVERTGWVDWSGITTAIRSAARGEEAAPRLRAKQPVSLVGTRWLDKHGDVWTLESDGLLYTPETAPFTYERVEKKFGPLKILADA